MITEARGNDAEKAKIENAHSTIMMSQLSARMKACIPSLATDISVSHMLLMCAKHL